MGRDRELSSSHSFQIHSGNSVAFWDSSTRRLEGSSNLISSIKQLLNCEEQTICDVGNIWMDEREPIAVAIIAGQLGYELGKGAPDFGLPATTN